MLKKYEALKHLTKDEMKKIVGGNPQDDGAGGCKRSTVDCTFMGVQGSSLAGKCAVMPATAASTEKCGCKLEGSGAVQRDTNCDAAVSV